jgi:hypothetical protein
LRNEEAPPSFEDEPTGPQDYTVSPDHAAHLRAQEAEDREVERRRQLQLLERAYKREVAESEFRFNVFQAEARISILEAYMRAGLSALLVIGTLVAVFVAIATRIEGDVFAQYLAPISGLAGLAVGYFFGRGTPRPDDGPKAPDGTSRRRA